MRKKLFAAALVFAALAIWLTWGNTSITVSEFTVSDEKIPEAFDGFRIAQVSDLHNAEFGHGNARLLDAVRSARPDIIVLTGDLVDSRRPDLSVALDFAAEAVKIAPVYYVSGNHEARIGDDYALLRDGLTAAGVTVLEDESAALTRGEESVTLMGAADIGFTALQSSFENSMAHLADVLIEMQENAAGYAILLSHRPELLETYHGRADLVLSGHAHGGQIRIPLLGGLFAPGQGFLPAYDAGLFHTTDTDMIVSRGLGNSVFPLRVNNRPEIVVITLAKLSS